ncbi:hypothetical protein G6011_00152 [Alternaria panax]|uniref:Uncharacterized protein n=1 Tax=Alternaria panax TaxID=48097 RepID=A0AAD4II61_9PLEO|nr:hypothetical protein G6011_00152 [Alternaria panax]
MLPTDLEKGNDAMTSIKHNTTSPRITNSVSQHSRLLTYPSIIFPLVIAYASLFLTNYYLSPFGPGYQYREDNSGRMSSLVVVLMMLCPEVIQNVFAVTAASGTNEWPCFGFGWLAYSAALLIPAVSGSVRSPVREGEFGVKAVDLKTGRGIRNGEFGVYKLHWDLESKHARKTDNDGGREGDSLVIRILEPIATSQPSPHRSLGSVLQNRNTATVLVQFCLAGLYCYYYNDLSILQLLSTSILLLEATANLPVQSCQKPLKTTNSACALMRDESPPARIFIILPSHSGKPAPHTPHDNYNTHSMTVSATILIAGGFLFQAMLCTQISDGAATVMVMIMFVGTVSNVAIAGLSGEPKVGGVKVESVGVVDGGKDTVQTLREVEGRYEGFGKVLIRECFPDKLGEWEGRKEKVVG